MTSRFTNKGLQLLAQYEVSPATKQPFSKLAIGTLTDAQAAAADLYDGTETELHGESVQIWDGVETTVDPNDSTHTTARVKATIVPAAAVKGQTIREVGLYITDENDNDVLVWIGKFPPTYIPAADEPDMQTNLVITVPIKFNSAETVSLMTNDSAFALKTELDETNANLANVETDLDALTAYAHENRDRIVPLENYKRDFRIFHFEHGGNDLTSYHSGNLGQLSTFTPVRPNGSDLAILPADRSVNPSQKVQILNEAIPLSLDVYELQDEIPAGNFIAEVHFYCNNELYDHSLQAYFHIIRNNGNYFVTAWTDYDQQRTDAGTPQFIVYNDASGEHFAFRIAGGTSVADVKICGIFHSNC